MPERSRDWWKSSISPVSLSVARVPARSRRAEVGLEHDHRELHYRIAWRSARLAAGGTQVGRRAASRARNGAVLVPNLAFGLAWSLSHDVGTSLLSQLVPLDPLRYTGLPSRRAKPQAEVSSGRDRYRASPHEILGASRSGTRAVNSTLFDSWPAASYVSTWYSSGFPLKSRPRQRLRGFRRRLRRPRA
jgi:hypothetical protein